MNNSIEILGYTAGIILLSPLVAYLLAKADVFFTLIESGNIKFIVRGETLHKIIFDVRNFKLVEKQGREIFIHEEGTKQPRPWFGLYRIGIPPFKSIHGFTITKESENAAGKTPDDWTTGETPEKISSLWFTFPRPFVLKDVELGDRSPIHILVVAKFQVVDPYKLVFLFKGKFFENTAGILKSTINDILKGPDEQDPLTLDNFVAANKGEVGGILAGMKEPEEIKDATGNLIPNPQGEFNRTLIEQVGLRLVGIAIVKYDSGDEEVRKAMNAQIIAQENAKGVKAKADGEAAAILTLAKANAGAKELLAKAQGVRIGEIADGIAKTKATHRDQVEALAAVLRAEALAGPDSKLTTLVDGSNTPAVVPVGGNKP